MGNIFTNFFKYYFGKRQVRLIVLGLENAGKTTILYQMKLKETITTVPTIGFNVETFEYMNVSFTVWDCTGRDKLRPLVKHYYPGTQGLIFVVDSADQLYLPEATEMLTKILADDDLRAVPCLILANKQDLSNAMSTEDIQNEMGLECLITNRNWHIQESCAFTGNGLYKGLEWLSNQIESSS